MAKPNQQIGKKKPIRILQVVGGMNRGGVETWLMHILRRIDRERFKMDFLVHITKQCAYDEEILALGSRIVPCQNHRRPWSYARNFKRILSEYGPYDVVHCHVHHYTGFILRLANQQCVPIRIAHSHADPPSLYSDIGLLRRKYLSLMKRWISKYATIGIGCSQQAAVALFGPNWSRDPRRQVLYCSIDLTGFYEPVDSFGVRNELGIPVGALVIGHVGRFQEEKNHSFLLEIAAELAKQRPEIHLLMVGDGPLRPDIEQKAAQLGLIDKVVFAGVRSDVPRLIMGAMDIFLFPSLHEGLPLVLMEAQAAGKPCFISDSVPREADIIPSLVNRLSLEQNATRWTEAIIARFGEGPVIIPKEARTIIEKSPFNISVGLSELTSLYESED